MVMIGRPEVVVIPKDFFSAFLVWLLLEVFSFILLPSFQLIGPEHKFRTWIMISVPLGVIGALLVGFSSQFIFLCHERMHNRDLKWVLIWLGQIGGWLGLIGVAFPLIVMCIELWIAFTQKF